MSFLQHKIASSNMRWVVYLRGGWEVENWWQLLSIQNTSRLLCAGFPLLREQRFAKGTFHKRDISQNCLPKHFCNLLFSTSKSPLLKIIPPMPKMCTDLLHQPTKLMTTRCRIVLAKRKSAKARSGEIPWNSPLFCGLIWILKQTKEEEKKGRKNTLF